MEAGLAPAEMVNIEFMQTLYMTEKVVFGNSAEGVAQMLMCSAFTGSKTSLGLDDPTANSERLKAIMAHLAAWARQASAEAHAEPYVETQDSVVYLALDEALRNRYLLETQLEKDGTISTVGMLLAPSEQLKRNTFGKDDLARGGKLPPGGGRRREGGGRLLTHNREAAER